MWVKFNTAVDKSEKLFNIESCDIEYIEDSDFIRLQPLGRNSTDIRFETPAIAHKNYRNLCGKLRIAQHTKLIIIST